MRYEPEKCEVFSSPDGKDRPSVKDKTPSREPGPEKLSEEVDRLCLVRAMKILEYSDRTEAQLRRKLKERNFPDPSIDKAVEYVRSFHYIDDRRYADSYVRSNLDRRSRREIREKLRERGVSSEIIEDVLSEYEFGEKDTIKKLFLKKYGKDDAADQKTYEKAIRYFGQKGYGYQDIRKALEEVIREADDAQGS